MSSIEPTSATDAAARASRPGKSSHALAGASDAGTRAAEDAVVSSSALGSQPVTCLVMRVCRQVTASQPSVVAAMSTIRPSSSRPAPRSSTDTATARTATPATATAYTEDARLSF